MVARVKYGRVVLALGLLGALAIYPAGPASAFTVPFNDPNVNGFIGFCNAQGQPITSGSTLDHPTFWTGVSSTAAPATYTHATLYAAQPIPYEDPSNWTSSLFTTTAQFSNAAHPMALGIHADNSLYQYLQAYPPHWDNLVQIRMYFSGGNGPLYSQPYPAAVIQIKGTTWKVVQGGTIGCHLGTVQSDLARRGKLIGPAATPTTTPSGSKTSTSGPTTTTAATSTSTTTGTSSTSDTAAGGSGTDSATTRIIGSGTSAGSSGGGISPGGIIGVIAGVAAAVAAAAFVVVRRRRMASAQVVDG